MSQGSISGVSHAQQVVQNVGTVDRNPVQKSASDTASADMVQLSSEARKRVEQMLEAETIAEAYLKHMTDPMRETAPSDTEQNLNEEEAKKRVSLSLEGLAVDLGWLVDALGLAPEEALKLQAAVTARSAIDYHQSRPPVPELIVHAERDDAKAAMFVHGLVFTAGRDGIKDVAVEKVAVIRMDPTLAGQLADPDFPRVVVVGDSERAAGVGGSIAAFGENLTARLAAAPPEQVQGMLIVRELAATPETRRLRLDALSRI